jgi:hypothetical protein
VTGCKPFEKVKVINGETEVGGAGVFRQPVDPLGAGNWDHVVTLGEEPRQCELSERDAAAIRHLPKFADHGTVAVAGVTREAWARPW